MGELAALEVLAALGVLVGLAAPGVLVALEGLVAIGGSTTLHIAAALRIEIVPPQTGLAEQLVVSRWGTARPTPGSRSDVRVAIWQAIAAAQVSAIA